MKPAALTRSTIRKVSPSGADRYPRAAPEARRAVVLAGGAHEVAVALRHHGCVEDRGLHLASPSSVLA
jgi:hypothetical protein